MLTPTGPYGSLGQTDATPKITVPFWVKVLGSVGAIAGAYHGYKRTNSYGWAILWSMGTSLAPFILGPVMVAQGFGKKKK